MKQLPQNASEAVRRLNPHLWPGRPPLGGVETSQPKSTPAQALARGSSRPQKRKGSVDAIITLVACRHRLLDSDNNAASFKPLRDAVAETIGIDDGSNRIRWEHEQIETKGEQGVIVKLQPVNNGRMP